MMTRFRPLMALALSCLMTISLAVVVAAPPSNSKPKGFFVRLFDKTSRELHRVIAERALTPKDPVAPAKIPVSWQASKVATLDLGARVLAFESVDINGDSREELVVLTTAELVILSVGAGVSDNVSNAATTTMVLARAPLPEKPAVIRARDPVGTIVIEESPSLSASARTAMPRTAMPPTIESAPAFLVRTSEQRVGGHYQWTANGLQLVGEIDHFPLCAGISADLVSGLSHFEPSSILPTIPSTMSAAISVPQTIRGLDNIYQLKCRSTIGPDGRVNHFIAAVGKGRTIVVQCSRGKQGCPPGSLGTSEVGASGYAFEITDVDRDGGLEVIASRGQARGKRDRLRAFGVRPLWDKWFTGGVIALGSADIDGDGSREVFAALRIEGTERFSLWQLTRSRRLQ